MPNSKKLHIVSFNIPYPPNYGGIIDVFHKIKELHQLNIQIYLHCFEYDRPQQETLEQYCKKVFYYQRASKIKSLLSSLPFIVKNRESNLLIQNLKKPNAPILFEGLHTSFPLTKTTFSSKVYIRTHNIEHNYFKGLAKSESNVFKKLFYQLESFKLKKYENIIHKVDGVFTISPFEQNYFQEKINDKAIYIPVFHEFGIIKSNSSKEKTVLYHGDLRISDNIKSVHFLIEVYKNTSYKFIIASSTINKSILKKIKEHSSIKFVEIKTDEILDDLLKSAHINVIFSFQKTGIKLKLLNTLQKSTFVIANKNVLEDTGLETICAIANTSEEFLKQTELLCTKELTEKEFVLRKGKLKAFDPKDAALKLMETIFKQ